MPSPKQAREARTRFPAPEAPGLREVRARAEAADRTGPGVFNRSGFVRACHLPGGGTKAPGGGTA